jgi:sugar O-acyltransferase (sialic acid O-acetyltransferase NeuD family)
MKKVVLFGNSGIAEIAHFYLTHDSEYEVSGFTVDAQYVSSDSFMGLPLVPFEEATKAFPTEDHSMLVAVSYTGLNKVRAEKYQAAKELGYKFITYINSKSATWNNPNIGENCFILEHVTIQPFSRIGNNVTIWSGSHIGHHSVVHDNCFITSHVVVSGNVEVGRNCFLGVNSTLRDGIRIGDRCIIGAGAQIMKDTDEDSVYSVKASEKSQVPSHKIRL